MPSKYRHDVLRLRAEVAARVAAGESWASIGARPGLPARQTVRAWARADGLFAAELGRAEAEAETRRLRFDEEVAAAFLARARAGEPVNAILREPGMPGRRAYRYWQAPAPAFAAAVYALRQRRDAEIGRHGRARWRAWNPALGDRIIVAMNKGATLDEALAADPELPSKPIVRRWRREQPEFDAVLRRISAVWRRRRTAARGCTPEVAQRIVDHIIEGGSFASVSREPGMPTRATLRRWFHARPDFADAVTRACVWREDWYDDQIMMIAESLTGGTVAAAKRRIGPLKRHLVRLRHRPGAVHRKRAAGQSEGL